MKKIIKKLIVTTSIMAILAGVFSMNSSEVSAKAKAPKLGKPTIEIYARSTFAITKGKGDTPSKYIIYRKSYLGKKYKKYATIKAKKNGITLYKDKKNTTFDINPYVYKVVAYKKYKNKKVYSKNSNVIYISGATEGHFKYTIETDGNDMIRLKLTSCKGNDEFKVPNFFFADLMFEGATDYQTIPMHYVSSDINVNMLEQSVRMCVIKPGSTVTFIGKISDECKGMKNDLGAPLYEQDLKNARNYIINNDKFINEGNVKFAKGLNCNGKKIGYIHFELGTDLNIYKASDLCIGSQCNKQIAEADSLGWSY